MAFFVILRFRLEWWKSIVRRAERKEFLFPLSRVDTNWLAKWSTESVEQRSSEIIDERSFIAIHLAHPNEHRNVEVQLADEKRGDRSDCHPRRRKRKAQRRGNVSSIDRWERFSAVMIFSSFTKTNHWDIKATTTSTKTRISSFFTIEQVRWRRDLLCFVLTMDFKSVFGQSVCSTSRAEETKESKWRVTLEFDWSGQVSSPSQLILHGEEWHANYPDPHLFVHLQRQSSIGRKLLSTKRKERFHSKSNPPRPTADQATQLRTLQRIRSFDQTNRHPWIDLSSQWKVQQRIVEQCVHPIAKRSISNEDPARLRRVLRYQSLTRNSPLLTRNRSSWNCFLQNDSQWRDNAADHIVADEGGQWPCEGLLSKGCSEDEEMKRCPILCFSDLFIDLIFSSSSRLVFNARLAIREILGFFFGTNSIYLSACLTCQKKESCHPLKFNWRVVSGTAATTDRVFSVSKRKSAFFRCEKNNARSRLTNCTDQMWRDNLLSLSGLRSTCISWMSSRAARTSRFGPAERGLVRREESLSLSFLPSNSEKESIRCECLIFSLRRSFSLKKRITDEVFNHWFARSLRNNALLSSIRS